MYLQINPGTHRFFIHVLLLISKINHNLLQNYPVGLSDHDSFYRPDPPREDAGLFSG